MAKFFISYSRKDSVVANKIRNHIYKLDSGHEVFLDVKSIKAGANWLNELQKQIKACDYFILIHSDNALHSKHVEKEIKWVNESELKTGIRKMIVYRLNYADITPALAPYQVLDATENFTVDFYRLMSGVFSDNSFYSVEYELTLKDEWSYKGKAWIEAPKKFMEKIQMVEYRFDYGWEGDNPIKTIAGTPRTINNKFIVPFITHYHLTLFVMIYLWNTKELSFVKKIELSH
jgi:hypothetical protein